MGHRITTAKVDSVFSNFWYYLEYKIVDNHHSNSSVNARYFGPVRLAVTIGPIGPQKRQRRFEFNSPGVLKFVRRILSSFMQVKVNSISLRTVIVLCSALVFSSCSRTQYRTKADKEVYAYIGEQSTDVPWAPELDFSIDPDPRSRNYDTSDRDDPSLPQPGPNLYAYRIPSLWEQPDPETDESESVTHEESPTIETAIASDSPSARNPPRIGGLAIQPIPKSYWEGIPKGCTARMMEFESVRDEYRKRYQSDPLESMRDQAERLSLRKIIQRARIESRENQSQKEQLYRAALALTSDRFDYAPKFSANGNGTDTDLTQTRRDGKTVSSTGISSNLEGSKMLSTGGTIMARLANEVVVTFNGPEGFATDVGSEFLFNLNQSLLQRDVRLNPLIQAERNLVYAARTYARFRKRFFEQLSSRYYALLQNYRSIEIESQNYISLIRTFEQAKAEIRAGVKKAPNQVAVDQFEQSMLSGRSSLISNWNRLEQNLDQLKITLGIPTETPINIDLEELQKLTLLDEIEVAGERVRRWRGRVEDRLANPRPVRSEILNANIFQLKRMLEWFQLRRSIGWQNEDPDDLELQLARFLVDYFSITVELHSARLESAQAADSRDPIILQFQRTADLIKAMRELAGFELQLGEKLNVDSRLIVEKKEDLELIQTQLDTIYVKLDEVLEDPRREKLSQLLSEAEAIKTQMTETLNELEGLIGKSATLSTENERLDRTLTETRELMKKTQRLLSSGQTGLLPIHINLDDAMATALIQRMDLMNQRGQLADDWRLIKITADDLKSVFNLNVSQTLGTRDNQPLNFSTDDSQTRLGLSFDLPANRLEQRNNFRRALINYQSGRRGLMEFEDNIKLDIRNRLRDLAETRLQYPISVTRAALAAEQVTSIRLQLALGVPGVRATDLLDALQDSRQALIDVANFRIRYIVEDVRFAIDLESMKLDEIGFWPHINDPDFHHLRNLIYPESAGPTYGDIPPYLKVSKQLKRIFDQPLPGLHEEDDKPRS
ncbi:MAG TPA: hypothetical protein EYG38_18565 [Verrucomicrobia bacterium]|nr:hypothetical protein [Verrucomicrobiota bacterium]